MVIGNFRLPKEQDAVAERASQIMKPGDIRILLISYGPTQRVTRPFARAARTPPLIHRNELTSSFEHMPVGHRLARELFQSHGQPIDVQVEFAKARVSDAALGAANNQLRRIHISAPSRSQEKEGSPTCRGH
jgi:hypothetical protein